MDFETIAYQELNRRATIVLQRPGQRNAMNDLMIKELSTAFLRAGKSQEAKIVILSALGSSFCAGADLKQLGRIAESDLEENLADSRQLANLLRAIHELRKPVIAAVNGPALAGGCGLVSVCDFVIASEERARFGYPEVKIGFIPAVVMIFLVKKVGEGRAREMVLRGNVINARDAMELGLVSAVVPEANLEASVDVLANDLLESNSLTSMGLCKEMLSKLHGMNLPDSLDFAAHMNAAARMTSDCKRGIRAFLNKERIHW
jgi:methylglutaconyl-CoA hydratase